MNNYKSAFTLLEILLVLVLLSFLSYSVYYSVKMTTKAKESVESRTETLQEFRSAFGILERDIRNTFYTTPDDYGWYPHKPTTPDTPPDKGYIPPVPQKPLPLTVFQGKENTLLLSTRTHQRLSANAPENEEHFVFYTLKDGALIRSESKRAISKTDRENPEDFRSFILIEKVVSLKFTFWSPRQGQWVGEWDSDKTETLNKVPEAVKIELRFTPEYESEKGGKKSKELTLVTAVRLPEAWYRNIDWSQSSKAPSRQTQTSGQDQPPQ
jgi:type II secretory pathway pseudopilin PulG